MVPINKRYVFVILFDVVNGNPNGDPDADNRPRTIPETGHGIITDVCIKRLIRNAIAIRHGDESGYRIYVSEGTPLQSNQYEAIQAVGYDPKDIKEMKKDTESVNAALQYMLDNFYDVRTFGAVMPTLQKCNNGQIMGPVQFSFAESIDPVVPQRVQMTRCTIEKEEKADDKSSDFAHKYIIPYGLYSATGFISPNQAEKTGFTESDLESLWDAITWMFEYNKTATKGIMTLRKLIVFEDSCKNGSAPAHTLLESIQISKRDGVETPGHFNDYVVTVNSDHLPESIKTTVKDC